MLPSHLGLGSGSSQPGVRSYSQTGLLYMIVLVQMTSSVGDVDRLGCWGIFHELREAARVLLTLPEHTKHTALSGVGHWNNKAVASGAAGISNHWQNTMKAAALSSSSCTVCWGPTEAQCCGRVH